MRCYGTKMLSLVGLSLAVASAASAGENPFKGLIPGEPLAEAEYAEIHGKGPTFSFTLQDGSLVSNQGSLANFDQTSNQVANTSSNSGIIIPTQFVGDNNVVNVTVALEVNIGTVTVTDTQGSQVSVNQAVDLTGALDFGIGR